MYIVTVATEDDRSGCLVGFCSQASMSPTRFVVFVAKVNHTYKLLTRTEWLVLHFLSAQNHNLAALFGEQTDDSTDKFAVCHWFAGPRGIPVLSDCRGWVFGQILDRFDAGDHVAHLLDPLVAEAHHSALPQLSYQDVKELHPGHPL
jgi:flavin reductase (DIM6/NTAB) family NADH-FMN oxidoreductase RutF